MRLIHQGKVRDLYDDDGELLLVASDRMSVYDVVLPTPIPDKGKILTALSLWWFDRLSDVVPNHVLSATEVPLEFSGRAIRCRRLDMLRVECIARGYLAGLGLREYLASGAVSGVPLPPGLLEGSKLPRTVFTPTTKEEVGTHDEFITFEDVVEQEGEVTGAELRDLTLAVYERGAAVAAEQGVIIADTKLEFGRAPDGQLILGDELLTSDSSRFWLTDEWEPGRPQFAFDKQYLRDWAAGTGWDKKAPGPTIPPDVVEATRSRYVQIYERITGETWR